MAKKKIVSTVWDQSELDEMLDAQLEQQRARGNEIYSSSEGDERLIGLYLEHLCLRYFFQSNIYPLGRTAVIVGQHGSGKSAFLYETMRWHRRVGPPRGRNFLAETEEKDSPELRSSICQYDPYAAHISPCHTQEEWQDFATRQIQGVQTLTARAETTRGPARNAAYWFGVDSLTAVICRETGEKILKDGHAERAFPVEAMKLANWFRAVPQMISGWPFSLVATNHLKPGQDARGMPTKNVPGGMSPKFMETYEIEMARIKDVKRADYEGIRVQFNMSKNSLGPGRKKIVAELLWYMDLDQDPVRQVTWWDWDAATIELLEEIHGAKGALAQRIDEVVDLHFSSAGGKKCWSRALDIPSSDPVPYRTAGAMLEQRPDLLEGLHRLLGVRQRKIFRPGVDYRQQMKESGERRPGTAIALD